MKADWLEGRPADVVASDAASANWLLHKEIYSYQHRDISLDLRHPD
jgi:hypothetical protein